MPIQILMPALSPTMEEGTLSKWLVAEGDTVSSGDLLAEIETDKATMEVEAVEEGVIAKLLVAGGAEGVKVNAPIAILLEEGETEADLDGFEAGGAPKAASKSATETQTKDASQPDPAPKAAPQSDPAPQASHSGDRIKASPLAKRLAKDAGLDLASLTGTGPGGRIVKADIEAAKAAPKSSPKAEAANSQSAPQSAPQSATTSTSESAGQEVGMPLSGGAADYLAKRGIVQGSYDLEPLDGMRKVIAKRLSESNNNVPDFPLTIDCEIDGLLAMRKELNSQAPEGVKISVNDMIIRACALALKHEPRANASYTPDGIAYHKNADVAVAVAVDGGLITPIVREANNKGLSTISTEMKDLAGRAKTKKLKPEEYQGGTFSVSNLGMFGIREFGSIINEPHGMIMSVGAGAPRPVVKDGALAVATVMTVTLTCDHRVVDGALGAQWLGHFKRYIEQPITMML
ncbi:pyruvate dehydrogenase complex dihydrolipoamide acetyltransferase [Fretibacter rubidus]|uniref:pyruvate dehydrogenase complex dihydrolipoamide acetyltransferase n=1 Tax=Fretibacter rubidus TaxID=570162 RepID=UPI00352AEFFD